MFILFTKKLQENNPMSLHNYLHNCKLEELGMIDFNPINILMKIGEITKTVTLATISHKPVGEENPYSWFVYRPLKYFSNTHEDKFQDQRTLI